MGTLSRRDSERMEDDTMAWSSVDGMNQKTGEGRYAIGTRVVIHGLQHKPALNGHLAIVVAYLPEQDRFQVRTLGRAAQRSSKSKFVAIRSQNMRPTPSSAFVACVKMSNGRQLQLPLICRVELDAESKLVVRLMYDEFRGESEVMSVVEELEGPEQSWKGNGSVSFGVVNSPIYDEYARRDVSYDGSYYDDDEDAAMVDDSEILIMHKKPAIRDLFEAMLEYELVEELDKTVDVGLHGTVNLCRLRFPFQVEQS